MKILETLLIILQLLFFNYFTLVSSSAAIVTIRSDNYIIDLKSNTEAYMLELTAFWTINGGPVIAPEQVLNYNDVYAMGGPRYLNCGEKLSRTYDSLPAHNMISFSFHILVFDRWQADDYMYIHLDEREVFSYKPAEVITAYGFQLAGYTSGADDLDSEFSIVGRFYHTGPSLTFSITSCLPVSTTADASYSIDNLNIILFDTGPNDVEQACLTSPEVNILRLDVGCQCDISTYVLDPATCDNCDPACYGCFGPTASECYSCAEGFGYDKEIDACVPCPSDCSLCSSPDKCTQCNVPDFNPYPPLFTYLYWDGTCHSSCDNSKYVTKGFDMFACETKCQSDNSYYISPDVCIPTCDPPLEPRIEGTAKFCESPCTNPSDYVYWDGSCDSGCPYTSSTVDLIKICKPCPANEFFYPNLTCHEGCVAPFKQRSEDNVLYCEYPCSGDTPFYSVQKGKCITQCEYPYQIVEEKFCILNLPKEKTEQIERTDKAVSTTGSVTSILAFLVGFFNYFNPTGIFVDAFSDMISQIQYLNVKCPSNLEYYFSLGGDGDLLQVPDGIANSIPVYHPEGRIGEFVDNSSFLVNMWQPIILLLSMFAATMLTCGLLPFVKNSTKLSRVLMKVKNALKWNFMITFFASYFGQIMIYSSLEVRNLYSSAPLSIFSFVLCFFTNFLVFVTLLKMLAVIHNQWNLKNTKATKEAASDSDADFEVLTESYKDTSLFQQYFIVIFIMRIYIFVGAVAYLTNYPLCQAIIGALLSLVMFLYLIILRPLKGFLDLTQNVVQELVMLIIKTCVLILACLDRSNQQNEEFRDTIGEIIIWTNIGLEAFGLLYQLIQTALMLKDVVNAIRLYLKTGKFSAEPQQALSLPPSKAITIRELPRAKIANPLPNARPISNSLLESSNSVFIRHKTASLNLPQIEENSPPIFAQESVRYDEIWRIDDFAASPVQNQRASKQEKVPLSSLKEGIEQIELPSTFLANPLNNSLLDNSKSLFMKQETASIELPEVEKKNLSFFLRQNRPGSEFQRAGDLSMSPIQGGEESLIVREKESYLERNARKAAESQKRMQQLMQKEKPIL